MDYTSNVVVYGSASRQVRTLCCFTAVTVLVSAFALPIVSDVLYLHPIVQAVVVCGYFFFVQAEVAMTVAVEYRAYASSPVRVLAVASSFAMQFAVGACAMVSLMDALGANTICELLIYGGQASAIVLKVSLLKIVSTDATFVADILGNTMAFSVLCIVRAFVDVNHHIVTIVIIAALRIVMFVSGATVLRLQPVFVPPLPPPPPSFALESIVQPALDTPTLAPESTPESRSSGLGALALLSRKCGFALICAYANMTAMGALVSQRVAYDYVSHRSQMKLEYAQKWMHGNGGDDDAYAYAYAYAHAHANAGVNVSTCACAKEWPMLNGHAFTPALAYNGFALIWQVTALILSTVVVVIGGIAATRAVLRIMRSDSSSSSSSSSSSTDDPMPHPTPAPEQLIARTPRSTAHVSA
jgi:hypothetical protein